MTENTDISAPLLSAPARRRSGRILRRVLIGFALLLVMLFIAAVLVFLNRNLVIEQVLLGQLKSRGYDAALRVDDYSSSEATLSAVSLAKDGEQFFSAKTMTASFLWDELQKGKLRSLTLDEASLTLTVDETGKIMSRWLPEGGSGGTLPQIFANDFKVNVRSPFGALNFKGSGQFLSKDDISADITLLPAELNGAQRFPGAVARMSGQTGLRVTSGQVSFDQTELLLVGAAFDDVQAGQAALTGSGTLKRASSAAPMSFDGEILLKLTDLQSGLLRTSGDVSLKGLATFGDRPKPETGPETGPETAPETDSENDLSRLTFNGQASAQMRDVVHRDVTAQAAMLSFDGRAGYQPPPPDSLRSGVALDGAIVVSLTEAKLTSAAQARDLARRLALADTLASTPIAQYFYAGFRDQIERALLGADLSAAGKIRVNAQGRRLILTKPLRISAGQGLETLSLFPAGEAPVYDHRAAAQSLTMLANIEVAGARGLMLRNFLVKGPLQKGWLWHDIDAVSGSVLSDQAWRAPSPLQTPSQNQTYAAPSGPDIRPDIRLGPFEATLTYSRLPRAAIRLQTDIDYDGPLLGVEFTGLQAGGQVDILGEKGGAQILLAARGETKAQRVKTALGWDARDLAITLSSDKPVYKRAGENAELSLTGQDFSAKFENVAKAALVDFKAARIDIAGSLAASSQSWTVNAAKSALESENVPGPGTRAKAEAIAITLAQKGSAPWQYGITSPALNFKAKPLTLLNMGVTLSGEEGNFTAQYQGGTAVLDGGELPTLPLSGTASLQSGVLTGKAETFFPRAKRYPILFDYRYQDGEGRASIEVPKFVFAPGGVQPADLVKVLKGKIADVRGEASAQANLRYIPGAPLQSSGQVTLKELDIGTLVGPFTGLTADLEFSSLFPLRSAGEHEITMTGFDPGVPLGAGTVRLAVVENGVDIRSARWPVSAPPGLENTGAPIGLGEIFVQPTLWRTDQRVNRAVVEIKDVSLGDVVARLGNDKLSATGLISGTLPIVVEGVTTRVDGGRLDIANGGVISVRAEGLDRAAKANETAKIAIDALSDFRYQSLSLEVDGPLDGDITLGSVFTGSNPKVLGGADFLFRVNIEGELVNIARSFSKNVDVGEYLRLLEGQLEAAPR